MSSENPPPEPNTNDENIAGSKESEASILARMDANQHQGFPMEDVFAGADESKVEENRDEHGEAPVIGSKRLRRMEAAKERAEKLEKQRKNLAAQGGGEGLSAEAGDVANDAPGEASPSHVTESADHLSTGTDVSTENSVASPGEPAPDDVDKIESNKGNSDDSADETEGLENGRMRRRSPGRHSDDEGPTGGRKSRKKHRGKDTLRSQNQEPDIDIRELIPESEHPMLDAEARADQVLVESRKREEEERRFPHQGRQPRHASPERDLKGQKKNSLTLPPSYRQSTSASFHLPQNFPTADGEAVLDLESIGKKRPLIMTVGLGEQRDDMTQIGDTSAKLQAEFGAEPMRRKKGGQIIGFTGTSNYRPDNGEGKGVEVYIKKLKPGQFMKRGRSGTFVANPDKDLRVAKHVKIEMTERNVAGFQERPQARPVRDRDERRDAESAGVVSAKGGSVSVPNTPPPVPAAAPRAEAQAHKRPLEARDQSGAPEASDRIVIPQESGLRPGKQSASVSAGNKERPLVEDGPKTPEAQPPVPQEKPSVHAENKGIPRASAENTPPATQSEVAPVVPDSQAKVGGVNKPPSEGAKAYAQKRFGDSMQNSAGRPGVFRRALSWLATPITAPASKIASWLDFQGTRADINEQFSYANTSVGRAKEKLEKSKMEYEVQKANVANIQDALGVIEKTKKEAAERGEFIAPRDAAKMEKERRKLTEKLIKAELKQDDALRVFKNREYITINHENKRAEIAGHYAELVDSRLAPRVLERQGLEEKKRNYESEIVTWKKQISGYETKVSDLRNRAAGNPFLKHTFKAQIKDLENRILESRKLLTERTNGVTKIDTKLIGVENVLRKWDNKKKWYAKMASERIEKTEEDYTKSPNPAPGYASPIASYSTAESNRKLSEGAEVRLETQESAPTVYGLSSWVEKWNSLAGTELKLDEKLMVNKGDARQLLGSAQFKGVLKDYIKKLKKAGSPVSMADSRLDMLSSRVLDGLTQDAVNTQQNRSARSAYKGADVLGETESGYQKA